MMLARTGVLLRRRRFQGKPLSCATPNITGYGASVVTGTNFLSTQGSGYLQQYLVPPGAWQTWPGSYMDWNDTTVTLDGALDGAATKIRIINDCGEMSNEYPV